MGRDKLKKWQEINGEGGKKGRGLRSSGRTSNKETKKERTTVLMRQSPDENFEGRLTASGGPRAGEPIKAPDFRCDLGRKKIRCGQGSERRQGKTRQRRKAKKRSPSATGKRLPEQIRGRY